MFLYNLTLQRATGISYAIHGNFSGTEFNGTVFAFSKSVFSGFSDVGRGKECGRGQEVDVREDIGGHHMESCWLREKEIENLYDTLGCRSKCSSKGMQLSSGPPTACVGLTS